MKTANKFNSSYKKIIEDGIPGYLFKNLYDIPTPAEEIKYAQEKIKREKEQIKIKIKEMIDTGKITKNTDGSYDAEGDINLNHLGLTKIPIRFNRVGGHFGCIGNKLTTLEGCPKYVGGHFGCWGNQLTNLNGSPEIVGGTFVCDDNKLTTLDGAPKSVGEDFECFNNTKKFTKKEVRDVCKVRGGIFVDG